MVETQPKLFGPEHGSNDGSDIEQFGLIVHVSAPFPPVYGSTSPNVSELHTHLFLPSLNCVESVTILLPIPPSSVSSSLQNVLLTHS